MRRVEQDHLGSVRDGGAEPGFVESELGRVDAHGDTATACHRDGRAVRVVERLERDDLVTCVDEGQHRGGDRLGRAGCDEHLGVRVQVGAVPTLLVLGDRVSQDRNAGAGRVLVASAGPDRVHRGVGHGGRSVDVGEPLAEVDRPGRHREGRHLGEDRGAEPGEMGDEAVTAHGPTVRWGRG